MTNTDIIRMDRNENPLGCSPKALDALHRMSSETLAAYSSPDTHPIRQKLAKKLNVNSNQLFLSSGSDNIFSLLLVAFTLQIEKHILTHEYAFSSYVHLANLLKIPVHSVKINDDWQININNLLKACTTQTGIIFLANPNNPTGGLADQQEIKHLIEHIPESTLLVIDEAYYEYAASQYSSNSIDWLAAHSNLVITRTFSKIYGLAGLRLGYALAHPSIISILERTQWPFIVNQAALAAANAALDDEEFIHLSLQANVAGLQQLREGFDRLHINYLPSAANFLTFDCQEDSDFLFNYLLNKRIILRTLSTYNMNHYMRVTIGTKEHNVRFLDALDKYCRK